MLQSLPELSVGADALGRLAVQPALMPAVINTTGIASVLYSQETMNAAAAQLAQQEAAAARTRQDQQAAEDERKFQLRARVAAAAEQRFQVA